jgi:hypothetical protein
MRLREDEVRGGDVMSDQYGSRFGRPEPQPEDLETVLARAMRAEADRVTPAGDGLAKIRARTENRRRAFGWFSGPAARPLLAGGMLVFTLIAGTVIGLQVTDGGGESQVVDGPRDPVAVQPLITPEPKERVEPTPEAEVELGPEFGVGGGDFPITETTEAPADAQENLLLVEPEQERNRSDGGIPVDDGGNYVAIEAPLSGRSYSSPLTLAGKARVFEASITIDISQNGKVLKRAYATATEGAPELGEWQATIELAPGNYRIDAYALSPEDGETKLASDSIWITILAPSGATGPTPTPSPSPSASPESTATPVATSRSDVPGSDD